MGGGVSGPGARAAMGSAGGFAAASAAAAAFAFGLGANDVANSFGTSVGSGAVTLRQAVLIAVVCEVAGAVGLGRGVSNTLTEKISHLQRDDCWDCDGPDGGRVGVFALGMACALAAGGLFLLLATLKGLPVSTTHTIVGGVLGITVLGTSGGCVLWGWPGLLKIVASWFVSPAASGLASCLVLWGIQRCILGSRQPFQSALFALPLLFGGTLSVLAMLVLESESPWAFWIDTLAALGAGVLAAVLARVIAVPLFRARVELQARGEDGEAIELGAVEKEGGGGGGGTRKWTQKRGTRQGRTKSPPRANSACGGWGQTTRRQTQKRPCFWTKARGEARGGGTARGRRGRRLRRPRSSSSTCRYLLHA